MHASDPETSLSSNGFHPESSAAQLDMEFAGRVTVLTREEDVALPTTISKRDGRVVAFEPARIERAIARCFAALGREPYTPIAELALRVVNIMSARPGQPSVEAVQDAVELTLQAAGEFEAAKAYILYRAEHAKQRQERPIPDEVRDAFAEADQYFPTPIQKFQFFDKYSRFDYEKGRRETWIETVDRAVSFLHELVQTNTGADLGSETFERVRRAILEMRSMPSMRLLAMAGAPARRDSTAIYNCSYLPVDSVDSFCDALLISMAGCGVGFSVESRYVESFPRVHRQRGLDSLRHVIEDSAQGWAAAVRLGLETWFDGGDVEFDMSQIRSAGTPLRTKGGRASGPGPLKTMLEFSRARILARQGVHLRPIDAHDIMCMVGNAAVSGGVRRTAMISLFDYDDLEMRLCKSGDFEHDNSQRWNANNSAVWPERGLDQIQVVEQVLDMVKSQRGEPGIFNRKAALDMIPDRRKALGYEEYGTNPCVTGDTWVLTTRGPRQVRELVGQLHGTFVNGSTYSTTEDGFWKTGTRPVLQLRTREGYALRLTGNHELLTVTHQSRKVQRHGWRRADQLRPGDRLVLHRHRGAEWSGDGTYEEGWLLGSLVGDGTMSTKTGQRGQLLTMAHLEYWGNDRNTVAAAALTRLQSAVLTRADCVGFNGELSNKIRLSSAGLARLAERFGITREFKCVSQLVERTSSDFHRGFLRAFFDADGSIHGTQAKGVSVRLSQSNLQDLEAAQRMLLRLGIASTIYAERRPAGYRQLPDGRGGSATYWCRPDHELVIAGDNVHEFARVVGLSEPAKAARLASVLSSYRRQPNRERFTATIDTITPAGVEDVYDCAVPGPNAFDGNGFYAHNCGEIILRKNEFCNLSIAVARQDDTLASLKDKVEIATIIGTIQSLATHFPDLRPIWKQNCIEERLLGVDITGQMDSPAVHDPSVMQALRAHAVETNRVFAEKLGINQSAAVTTVKPSGNSSQLLNCSSGLHARWAPYYERNVRVATTSPIFKVLRDAGVPMDPENGQTRDDANCVTPETKILTEDLRWVRAGDLKEGDGIIGFDDVPEAGKKRHYRRAKITYAGRKLSRVLRITLDDGQVLRCTPDHKWLVIDASDTATWMSAEEMLRKARRKNGHIRLAKYWNVYDTDTSYGAGYLAGLLDGEGYLGAVARTTNIGFIQNEGGVYERGVTELEARGYQVVTRAKLSGFGNGEACRQVAVLGGRTEPLRLLSEVRPMRLVEKLVSRIHTLSLVAFGTPSITAVEEDGEQEIAVLSSNCQTYLAEGFAAHNTWVIHFPVKAPNGAVTRNNRSAIEQCDYWLHNKVNWTEHNPSVTCTYRPDEIVDLTKWIWEHRDLIGGMAFLPTFDAHYAQLPYIEITKEEFDRRTTEFPTIDFSKLFRYESTDLTTAAQELACLAGNCEVDS